MLGSRESSEKADIVLWWLFEVCGRIDCCKDVEGMVSEDEGRFVDVMVLEYDGVNVKEYRQEEGHRDVVDTVEQVLYYCLYSVCCDV